MSKTRRIRVLSLFVAVTASLGLMALPAQASDPLAGVVVFQGEAEIGDVIPKDHGKKTDECTKSGSGLNAPLVEDEDGPLPVKPGEAKKRCWTFESIAGGCDAVTALPLQQETCTIQAEGNVGSVDPLNLLGAWCGLSQGWAGKGKVELLTSGRTIYLNNVGWVTSAGSILPINGNAGKAKGDTSGLVVGLVQASGSTNTGEALIEACLQHNGATSFQVTGIAAAVAA